MYGLVNKGLESFITDLFGRQDWDDLCRRAGLEEVDFEGTLVYPDDVSYRLVDAISDKYGMSREEALEAFGAYWVPYTKTTSLGKLLRFGGSGFLERLDSLDAMHRRVKMSLPHLQPPSFEFEEGPGSEHWLHYSSVRAGLEPMVIGLLRSLAEDSGERVEIEQEAPAHDGVRATFRIRMAPSS